MISYPALSRVDGYGSCKQLDVVIFWQCISRKYQFLSIPTFEYSSVFHTILVSRRVYIPDQIMVKMNSCLLKILLT